MSIAKEPEQVMKMRGGSVLGKRTILKSDHFPGCQNKRLTPQIDGAPNYRQVCSFYSFDSLQSLFLEFSCISLVLLLCFLVLSLFSMTNLDHTSVRFSFRAYCLGFL